MPDGVVQYIAKHDLYPPKEPSIVTATDHAVELVVTAARAASDKLAQQIIAFDVSEQLAITDAFLLASRHQRPPGQGDRRRGRGQAARDRRQADPPRGRARRPLGAHRLRRVVVHVQHEEERQFYALERLWRDCPSIALPADVVSPR